MKRNYFTNLYKSGQYLALLNWVYGLIAVVALVLSGITALINQPLGNSLLIIPAVFSVALAANVVAWSLIKLLFDALTAEKPQITAEKAPLAPEAEPEAAPAEPAEETESAPEQPKEQPKESKADKSSDKSAKKSK